MLSNRLRIQRLSSDVQVKSPLLPPRFAGGHGQPRSVASSRVGAAQGRTAQTLGWTALAPVGRWTQPAGLAGRGSASELTVAPGFRPGSGVASGARRWPGRGAAPYPSWTLPAFLRALPRRFRAFSQTRSRSRTCSSAARAKSLGLLGRLPGTLRSRRACSPWPWLPWPCVEVLPPCAQRVGVSRWALAPAFLRSFSS